ncbi:MAG: hypothetical protein IPK82_06060 [Polyangiaceae bacterium]|nr:hypothetical protein [Polyangiaceae bacterium]
MGKYGWGVALIAVGVLSFILGRISSPRIRFETFPELGTFRATEKACLEGFTPKPMPNSFIMRSLDYSPGDSPGVEVTVWRRTANHATLLNVGANLPDDEVDAEGKELDLVWTKAGWSATKCRAVVRHHDGRP